MTEAPAKPATLFLLCGKMAAGKSTLAKTLADQHDALLLVLDDLLEHLFPDAISDLGDFVRYSARVRDALEQPVLHALARGVDVVLDFPGNTKTQRAWFRHLIEISGADHELHFIDVSDAVCKTQLRKRSQQFAEGTAWTTDAELDAVNQHFEAPRESEGFHVIHHPRASAQP